MYVLQPLHMSFQHGEASNETGNLSLIHLKLWFGHSKKKLLCLSGKGEINVAYSSDHKKLAMAPRWLNQSPTWKTIQGIAGEGTTQTNSYQQQKEQDTVKKTLTIETLLIPCRQGKAGHF